MVMFQRLADGVIPNEYGINPQHKLIIGAKVSNQPFVSFPWARVWGFDDRVALDCTSASFRNWVIPGTYCVHLHRNGLTYMLGLFAIALCASHGDDSY